MKWLLGWFVVALVTVIPLLVVLYTLDQRGHLGEDPTTTSRVEAAGVGEIAAGSAAADEAGTKQAGPLIAGRPGAQIGGCARQRDDGARHRRDERREEWAAAPSRSPESR